LIVLPDLPADGSCSLDFGQLCEPSTECKRSMHDRERLTSDAFVAIFRATEASLSFGSDGNGARTVK
jgi:hypothetical protein